MRRGSRVLWLGASLILSASRPGATGAATGPPALPADAVAEARAVEEALNGVRGLVASFTQTVE